MFNLFRVCLALDHANQGRQKHQLSNPNMPVHRAPSPRELVATLVACANNDDDKELQQLLVDQVQNLAEALHRTPESLRAVCAMPQAPRLARLGTLVKQARSYDSAAKARAMQRVATDAASQVASLAKWREDCVELDAAVVLGAGLVADRARKFVYFDADGFDPVLIRRQKLVEARRSLHIAKTACSIDARGLCFSWGRKGRLVLTSQPLAPNEMDIVLSVVIARPVVPRLECSPVRHSRPSAVSWIIEALAHANSI
jgi:hypothetical protein